MTFFSDSCDAGSNTLAIYPMKTGTGSPLGCLRNQRVRGEALSHGSGLVFSMSNLVFSECWLLPQAVLGDMSNVPPPLSVSLFPLPLGGKLAAGHWQRGWGFDLACGWTGQLSHPGHGQGWGWTLRAD